MMDYSSLIQALLPVVEEAGTAIVEIYQNSFKHKLKLDGSPVTEADELAEKIVLNGLQKIASEIEVISEENPDSHLKQAPATFFLVDPLDGTREFLKCDGKGAFTVNIALIENGIPTMGIVFAPVLERMFFGSKNEGAFENGIQIFARQPASSKIVAVASQSHRDPKTDQWLSDNDVSSTISIGSSLKFGLLACGEADVYPRFSPTMEWDTAAGDAILRAAGGIVVNPDESPFVYGKAGYRNGAFIARGKTG